MDFHIRNINRRICIVGIYCKCILCVVFAAGMQCSLDAGELDSIRNKIRNSDKKEDQKRRDRDRDHCDDDDNGSFLNVILSSFFSSNNSRNQDNQIRLALADSCEYQQQTQSRTLGHEVSANSSMYFPHYPYADGYDSYLMPDDFFPARPQTGAIRFAFDYGTDFDNIDRWTGRLLTETSGGIGWDIEWSHFREKFFSRPSDSLNLADANLLFRWIETPRFQMRFGGGLSALVDGFGTDLGWNLTTVADLFPNSPLIISTQLDVGEIGSASHFHGAVTSGLNWQHAEFRVGYDFRKIGGVDLSGPSFGIRFWW